MLLRGREGAPQGPYLQHFVPREAELLEQRADVGEVQAQEGAGWQPGRRRPANCGGHGSWVGPGPGHPAPPTRGTTPRPCAAQGLLAGQSQHQQGLEVSPGSITHPGPVATR